MPPMKFKESISQAIRVPMGGSMRFGPNQYTIASEQGITTLLLPGSSGAQAGYGCISFNATAEEIAEELKLLSAIDDVQVSKQLADDYSSFEFQITFTGDLVRGYVDKIKVIDQGDNGCNGSPPNTAATVEIINYPALPVYRLPTTPLLHMIVLKKILLMLCNHYLKLYRLM